MTLRNSSHHRYGEQLRFLQRFAAYTTQADGERLLLWYWDGGSPLHLALRPVLGGVAATGDEAVARRVLQADAADLPPEEALPAEPAAHRLLRRRYGGIRPVLFANPFEGIAWTILGQQINVAMAVRCKHAVAERYGQQARGPAGPVRLFPQPEDLLGASVEDLRALHLSRAKAAALLGVARAGIDGDALLRVPTAEAVAGLQRLRGIGRWSAEYILLRVCGHPDVIPAGDVALQRAWTRLTGVPAGEAQVRAAAEAWAGWRSDFAFALWLDNLASRLGR